MLKVLLNDIVQFFEKINQLTFKDKMILIIFIFICAFLIHFGIKKYSTLDEHLTNVIDNEFIMFSNKTCPHCHTAKPEFKNLMKEVNNNKKYKTTCAIINEYSNDDRYSDINEYPTFKLYSNNKKNYVYKGKRLFKHFKQFLKTILQKDT
jgi:thiol-disulfide isomerase/thioredoxin